MQDRHGYVQGGWQGDLPGDCSLPQGRLGLPMTAQPADCSARPKLNLEHASTQHCAAALCTTCPGRPGNQRVSQARPGSLRWAHTESLDMRGPKEPASRSRCAARLSWGVQTCQPAHARPESTRALWDCTQPSSGCKQAHQVNAMQAETQIPNPGPAQAGGDTRQSRNPLRSCSPGRSLPMKTILLVRCLSGSASLGTKSATSCTPCTGRRPETLKSRALQRAAPRVAPSPSRPTSCCRQDGLAHVSRACPGVPGRRRRTGGRPLP